MKFEDLTVHVIPHSHLDLSWGGGYWLCRLASMDVMLRLLNCLKSDPEYKYTIEHVYAIRRFAEHASGSEVDELIEAIRDGRVDVSGLYHGTEENLPGPENLARQFLLGKGWLKRRFGIDTKIAWSMDTPGHTLQMPQLLKKSGIEFYVISCGCAGPRLFRWASPDGSEVLTYTIGAYNLSHFLGLRSSIDEMKKKIPWYLERIRDLINVKASILDDGGDWSKPDLETLNNIRRWNEAGNKPALKISTTTEFYEAVKGDAGGAPLLKGEMPTTWVYTPTHYPNVAVWNRRAEYSLRAAEIMETIRMILYGDGLYPKSDFTRCWEQICRVMEHNWGGRDGEVVGMEREHACRAAYHVGRDILRSAIEHIASLIEPKSDGLAIHVFNPTGSLGYGYAEENIDVRMYGEEFKGHIYLTDSDGNPVPFDLIERIENEDGSLRGFKIGFVAKEIPPYGFRTYYVRDSDVEIDVPSALEVFEDGIENEYYRVKVDGCRVSEILDKVHGRNLVEDGFFELKAFSDRTIDLKDNIGEVLGEEEEGEFRIKRGKARSKIIIESSILNSHVRKEITLYEGLRIIDLSLAIDWRGPKYCQLRVNLPFRFNGEYLYEVPFGRVRFPDKIDYWAPYGVPLRYDAEQIERFRWPNIESLKGLREVQNWIEMREDNYRILLCTDSSTYDFRGCLQHVPLRTVYSCGDPLLFYNRRGSYRWSYRIITGVDINPELEGILFMTPLETVFSWRRDLCRARRKTPKLPHEYSFIRIEDESIIITALKRAEDDDGIVLRAYNASDEERTVNIKMNIPFRRVYEANLLEEPMEEIPSGLDGVRLRFKKWEIKTLRIIT